MILKWKNVCSYNQPLHLSSHLCPLTHTSTLSCNSFPFSLIVSFSLAVESPTLKINILYIQNILDPHPLLVTIPLPCSLPTAKLWSSFQQTPIGFLTTCQSHQKFHLDQFHGYFSAFAFLDVTHIVLLESLLFFAFRTLHSHDFLCLTRNSSQNWPSNLWGPLMNENEGPLKIINTFKTAIASH